ncbi:hypothetical protein DL98DRAFT_541109 [Cadophora sp. DSE1049]|nr:hypothetical protein DL98DRAFT_541109 [Cadophora sp. DSE1049]
MSPEPHVLYAVTLVPSAPLPYYRKPTVAVATEPQKPIVAVAYFKIDDYSIERPRIKKLTGPNYRPWSVQVKRLLQGQSLWKVVELGVKTPTVTGAEAPKATEGVPTGAPTGTAQGSSFTGSIGGPEIRVQASRISAIKR